VFQITCEVRAAMEVRLATKLDIPDLVRLNAQNAEHHPDVFKHPIDTSEASHYFERLMGNSVNRVLITINNESVIGYLYFEIRRITVHALQRKKPEYFIHHIYIDRIARRQLDFVEEVAAVDRCYQVSFDIWNLNSDAKMFFEKRGFGVSRPIYSKNLRSVP